METLRTISCAENLTMTNIERRAYRLHYLGEARRFCLKAQKMRKMSRTNNKNSLFAIKEFVKNNKIYGYTNFDINTKKSGIIEALSQYTIREDEFSHKKTLLQKGKIRIRYCARRKFRNTLDFMEMQYRKYKSDNIGTIPAISYMASYKRKE